MVRQGAGGVSHSMRRFLFAVCCLIGLNLFVEDLAAQTEVVGPGTSEAASKEVIQSQLGRYVEFFNDRKFQQLSDLLTQDFIYHDDSSGVQVEGNEAFVLKLRENVEAEPTLSLQAERGQLVIEDPTTAKMSGSTTLRATNKPDEISEFVVTLKQVDSVWKISSIVEQISSNELQPVANEAISSLSWLAGTWHDDSAEKLQSRFEYFSGGRFLRRTIIESASQNELGFEIIGYDPNLNLVRSWTYFSDGSFGSGSWTAGDDHWRLTMTQTLADGRVANGTYIIRPTDENTMVIKIISREIDGEILPIGNDVTMSRVDETSLLEEPQEPQNTSEEK